MALEQNDNDNLLKAATSGDQEAFSALFRRHYKELYVHVYRITRSHNDVEDVIQDIYISVFQAIQGKDPRNFNLRAYLYKAAGRRAKRLLSSKDMEVPNDASSAAFEGTLEDAACEAEEAQFDDVRTEWRHEKIHEALLEGNEEKIDKWRDELRKIFPETEEPSE